MEDSGPYASEPNLLELIHGFVVFDAGTKKLCRQNQYFDVKAAQDFIHSREGGIIWHTQGSGKSLTMVWLAKWIRENSGENRKGARVLIITDRTELDEQIEKAFLDVHEQIYRTRSGVDLIEKLNARRSPCCVRWCINLAVKGNGEAEGDEGTQAFIAAIQKLPAGFKAKGDLHVFVDEYHRTQSDGLHKAMKALLPGTRSLSASPARHR